MNVMSGSDQSLEPPTEEQEPPSQPPQAAVVRRRALTHPRPAVNLRPAGTTPRFPLSPASLDFYHRHFPESRPEQWTDWRWQLKNRVTDLAALRRFLRLDPAEEAALDGRGEGLPVSVTPHYLSLLDPLDPQEPLRRSVIPVASERFASPGEAADPLHEDEDSPTPGLVHRYPDRVLFLATGFCSTFCRYCTRSRIVGRQGHAHYSRPQLQAGLDYIRAHPEVRDVLISGGDPLTLGDAELNWLLDQVTAIPHVEMVRLGTKVPAVLPQRVTPALTSLLKRHHPLWLSLHFTHPAELTPETAEACARLADAGIPLGSQTVLLAGINDRVEVLKKLFQGLLRLRVRPYYLYQCDPILGSAHFRTKVAKGLELIAGLRGHTTGYAVPTYVIDAPGGGGKVALYPEAVVGRREGDLLLRNYEGQTFVYPDRAGAGAGAAAECAWA